jgi:uncharacterized protein
MLSVTTAHAQTTEPKSQARVIVVGEGSVTVTPDYARTSGGVTTNAKTVKEATDANSKLVINIITAPVDAGIAKKDIRRRNFRSNRSTHRRRRSFQPIPRTARRNSPATAFPTRSM